VAKAKAKSKKKILSWLLR